ncbi:hypothetical protein C0Q70_03952 [Pomacea canaliculata]|uniref:Uncharacterized protein n=1 Tax=Pomacea canaliculata TaxID=400727 RepID=A0A2T7PU71_POMCA|nr:hypothetical protein C0Q70_03952 [Pomacea canaliculata]
MSRYSPNARLLGNERSVFAVSPRPLKIILKRRRQERVHFRVKGQVRRYGPLGVVLQGTVPSVLNEPPGDGRRPGCLQAAARQFTLLPWVAEIQAHDREIDEVI